jgi:transposase InsO family protein
MGITAIYRMPRVTLRHPIHQIYLYRTDQDCQFTSEAFTGLLNDHGIQIRMDGTGRWRDNIFVGRLWRSLK